MTNSTQASDLNMALPFTMRRERDYTGAPRLIVRHMFEDELLELCRREELVSCSTTSDPAARPYLLRFSQWIEVDTKASGSRLIHWEQGSIHDLVITSVSATDRYIMAGNIAVTDCPNFVRITVGRFNWNKADEADIGVCRDAWLAGQHDQAHDIAMRICPHTWPVLLAACELELGLLS